MVYFVANVWHETLSEISSGFKYGKKPGILPPNFHARCEKHFILLYSLLSPLSPKNQKRKDEVISIDGMNARALLLSSGVPVNI